MKTIITIATVLSMVFAAECGVAQTPVDTLTTKKERTDSLTKNLKEVTVTTQLMSSYAGHDVLYLSKENREFGNDALDAISSLPQFRTGIGDDQLTNARGEVVTIFINGHRADPLQLKALRADMIQRIDYYMQPPAKYATMAQGEVIDVTLKRVNRKAYSLKVNTDNALNSVMGDNRATGMFMDSLNMVIGLINESHRNINNQASVSTYRYADEGSSRFATDRGLYHGYGVMPVLAYQRYQGKHQFFTQASYMTGFYRQGEIQNVEMIDAQAMADGSRSSSLKNDNGQYALDLYYTYAFGPRKSLSVDVLNNLLTSRSTSRLGLDILPPFDGLNYESASHFNNKTYSLIAQADYMAPLWQGQFNGGLLFSYKDLHQKFNYTADYYANTRTYYAYAGYSVSAGLWSYNLSAGISLIQQHTAARSVSYVVPRPTVGISWNNRRNFMMSFNGRIENKTPSIGDLTESSSAIDRKFYSIGNPGLKPYTEYSAKIYPRFFTPDNRWLIGLELAYKYSHRPFETAIMTHDDYAVMQSVNISHSQKAWASFGFSYLMPFGLRVSPGVVADYYKFPMPAQRVEETTVSAILMLPC